MTTINLDRFLKEAEKITEKADEAVQIESAMKRGFAITPKGYNLGPEASERERQIEIISRVVYGTYNIERKPMKIKDIVFETERQIRKEIRLGTWKSRLPSRRTLERSLNYAASTTWEHPGGIPPLISISIGNYFVNPQNFDGETKEKILEIIQSYKK